MESILTLNLQTPTYSFHLKRANFVYDLNKNSKYIFITLNLPNSCIYQSIISLQIDDNVSSLVVAQLLFLQSESSKKPIHMYINSSGGLVTAGLGIYDTMQYVLPPVATWCVGQASSMASLLLSAGAHGMRHSLPNARIMIHQPSGGAQGQATDIQIQAQEIIKIKKQINGLFAKHTGLDYETIGTWRITIIIK